MRLIYEFSPTVQHFKTDLENCDPHEINVYLLGSADINSVQQGGPFNQPC